MATILTELAEARHRVRKLQKELDEYASRQFMGADFIVKQPDYRRLKADLLRARSVLRSLERKAR